MRTTVNIKGWSVTRETRTVNARQDPTQMTTYRFNCPRRGYIEVTEFWGDYKSTITPNEEVLTEQAMSQELRRAGAPTLSQVDDEVERRERAYDDDPMGGPGRYI